MLFVNIIGLDLKDTILFMETGIDVIELEKAPRPRSITDAFRLKSLFSDLKLCLNDIILKFWVNLFE